MRTRYPFTIAAVAGWITAVGVGFALLLVYGAGAGRAASAPTEWPPDSAIPFRPRAINALVFVHPHCPCTRATIEMFQRALLGAARPVACTFVACMPPGADKEWEQTALLETIRSIPGVNLFIDVDGVETTRFDAHTSGQVLVYDLQARLIFSGGVTQSRGQVGANNAFDDLAAVFDGSAASGGRWPVFGCPLLNAATCAEGDATCPP